MFIHTNWYSEPAKLGFASEGANGWGAVWAESGRLVQYHYVMLLARLGIVWERAKGRTQVLEAKPGTTSVFVFQGWNRQTQPFLQAFLSINVDMKNHKHLCKLSSPSAHRARHESLQNRSRSFSSSKQANTTLPWNASCQRGTWSATKTMTKLTTH